MIDFQVRFYFLLTIICELRTKGKRKFGVKCDSLPKLAGSYSGGTLDNPFPETGNVKLYAVYVAA